MTFAKLKATPTMSKLGMPAFVNLSKTSNSLTRWQQLYVECLTKTKAYTKWLGKALDREKWLGYPYLSEAECKDFAKEVVKELDQIAGERILRGREKSLEAKKEKEIRLAKSSGKDVPVHKQVVIETGLSPLQAAEAQIKKNKG